MAETQRVTYGESVTDPQELGGRAAASGSNQSLYGPRGSPGGDDQSSQSDDADDEQGDGDGHAAGVSVPDLIRSLGQVRTGASEQMPHISQSARIGIKP
jgi:hypothetical protein|eukprot:SAG25_NODE_700_length_5876_cov_13.604120_3_plen_99_part_00